MECKNAKFFKFKQKLILSLEKIRYMIILMCIYKNNVLPFSTKIIKIRIKILKVLKHS